MKIISYNVNGIRAAIKKDFIGWMQKTQPDVLCLQETKLQENQYPFELFEEIGYKSYLFCAEKKGYSGVAIITKLEPDHIEKGIGIEKYDKEGRFIRADFGDVSVASIYHPAGVSGEERQAFKMQWLDDYLNYVQKLRKIRPNLVLCGDYNIAHEEIDIHDPIRNSKNSGFLPEEREWVTKFLAHGFLDTYRMLYPTTQKYSWWSYRARARANNKGWRLDYCITTDTLRNKIKKAEILNEAVHSDHCPVVLYLE
ncbi:MAG: exodeoxyribonuclease III [Bacteroidales bacterium]